MATVTTLRCVFGGAGSKKVVMSWPYVDSEVTAINVQNLMNACLTNSTIFNEEPESIIGAELVSKTVTDIPVS